MIRFTDEIANLDPTKLQGFFVGWPSPPSAATHLELLKRNEALKLPQ